MSLKTKVKAGNITNLSDARYCAGMGVDWLSFPQTVVNPVQFKEITDWVTGPEFILEVTQNITTEVIKAYQVETLETTAENLHLINNLPDYSWVISIKTTDWSANKDQLITLKERIKFLVISLESIQPDEIKEIINHFKVLVHKTEQHTISELLTLPIEGINITGEDELRPGLKDFDKISSVLEELEEID